MSQQHAYPIGPPTKEDLDNVMRYGVCPVCSQPRKRFHHVETLSDETRHTMGLACPNGCTYDQWAEAERATLDNSR